MRVALSMLTFVPGGMGGTETYARELVRELRERGNVEVLPLVPRNARGSFEGEEVVAQVATGDSVPARLRAIAQSLLHARSIRQRFRADIVQYPFSIGVPRARRGQAAIVNLHDTQHYDLPELFSPMERIFRRFFYERPARRAQLILTLSEFSKRGLVEHLGIEPDRIRIVPLGVDASSFQPNTGDRQDFVLFPARGWKHKNHARLIEAMALVRRAHPGLRLVLTGGALDSLGPVPDWVEVRGNVPVSELRELYRSARVMAFPSLYEGFGLPPLEAMASGCPVATSSAGSLPEVVGSAAVTFDPTDAVDIARGIEEAIARGPELTQAGLEHVATFTWARCAEVHEEAYRAALALV